MCNLSMKIQLYLVKKDKIKGFFLQLLLFRHNHHVKLPLEREFFHQSTVVMFIRVSLRYLAF